MGRTIEECIRESNEKRYWDMKFQMVQEEIDRLTEHAERPHWHSDNDPYKGRTVSCPVGETDGVKRYVEATVMFWDNFLNGYRCYPTHDYQAYNKKTGHHEIRHGAIGDTFYLMSMEDVRKQLGDYNGR